VVGGGDVSFRFDRGDGRLALCFSDDDLRLGVGWADKPQPVSSWEATLSEAVVVVVIAKLDLDLDLEPSLSGPYPYPNPP
jgi:hypothetical protein